MSATRARTHLSHAGSVIAVLLALAPPAAAQTTAGPFGFTVEIALSPKAAAELKALSEKIVVSAAYYGEPTKAAARRADEMGQIVLGRDDVTISGAGGVADVPGRTVIARRLDWIADRKTFVNVNVYTARLSGPNNLLSCGFFEDALSVAREKPIAIACALIGER